MAPQVLKLFVGKDKHEIFREAFGVSFYLPFELFGLYAVHFGQVAVEHHFLVAQRVNAVEYL